MMIAGIDLGGTKVAVTLASQEGRALRLRTQVARSGPTTAIAEQAFHLLEEACKRMACTFADVQAVGISSCGPFVKKGPYKEVSGPNLCGGMGGNNPWSFTNDWVSIPLESYFVDHFKKVVMENDGVAALQAERLFGAAQSSSHCAYATWSTGLGFGLCVDGHLLAGKNGNAGHAGHTFISDRNEVACGCGNQGDAEAMLAGNGLERAWGRPAPEVFALAKQGDAQALGLVDQAVNLYASLLYNLFVTLDLELITIGGSVFLNNQDILLPRLRQALATGPRKGMAAMLDGAQLLPAQLGNHVADLGALAMAMPEEWVESWRQQKPWENFAEQIAL
jgi:glucokinase